MSLKKGRKLKKKRTRKKIERDKDRKIERETDEGRHNERQCERRRQIYRKMSREKRKVITHIFSSAERFFKNQIKYLSE